ncbi:MAG TPA: DUF4142 domain-containing protein [Ohtaekwangia sp.]|nr:DUF4142 domain-containing protein [Ohtaekwangia sp.]
MDLIRYSYFLGLSFIVVVFANCGTDTNKQNVEELNQEKFNDREEIKDAQFVVDALDAAYGILEVAQLGEEKCSDILLQGKAKQMIEGQTSVSVKLKTYAEAKGISIPFSGPEKTTLRVKRLYDKEGQNFDKAWRKEIHELTIDFSRECEKYYDKADTSLQPIIASSIRILHQHDSLLTYDKPE